MLSQIRPKSFLRYISLPVLGSVLEEFTDWSYRHGYTIGTLKLRLSDALQIDRFFQQHGAECLEDLGHDDFGKAWHHYRHLRPNTAGTVHQIAQFLREKGNLSCPLPQTKTPMSSELSRFSEYLRNLRGFESTTIQAYTRYLKSFLNHIGYDANTKVLTTLTSRQIEDFLYTCGKRLSRYSLQHVVAYLRTFLRFQYEQGVLRSPLHTMIDTPRIYRFEQLPRSLSWETVNALLLSIDRTNAGRMRDYTILFLMATYGLRSCEVVSLTLDDIVWRVGTIRIPQRKTRNQLILPLTDAAADVLIEYLKSSRPKLPYRELFLRIRAPYGLLKPTAVNEIFQRWIRISKLDIPFKGSHCIRHSYAVHLLRQGTSVKSIGDLLGHRNAESTCVYLRLATEDLRSVALPVPEGVWPDLGMNVVKRLRRRGARKEIITSPSRSSPLRSFLTDEIKAYLQLKRSLGRNYRSEAGTLHSLDDFLVTQYPLSEDLTAEMFSKWCATLHYLSSTVRRRRMQDVRFFRYLATTHPESLDQSQRILNIPFKRTPLRTVEYLEFEEIDAVLQTVDRSTLDGSRDYALLSLMFNTGARVQEIVDLKATDLELSKPFSVRIYGKGRKERICPIWPETAHVLREYIAERGIDTRKPLPVFTNHLGTCLTRFGVRYVLAKYLRKAVHTQPLLGKKRLHPHSMRHSTAVHLLKSGVDLSSIANWLGHVSINTTNKYATMDLEMKRNALAKAKPLGNKTNSKSSWRKRPDILAWLESL